jgi:hypothetical protein
MTPRICVTCGAVFDGAGRARYCSGPCKRFREFRARSWDRLNRVVRCLRAAASRDDYPPARREEYARRADALVMKIGARP